jgi:hypothetical protein
MIIKKINWPLNEVIVMLENIEDPNLDVIPVSINYNLNAFMNADSYY